MRTFHPTLALLAGLMLAGGATADDHIHRQRIQHVLLISIDGMHSVDFINCARGVNGGAPYCPSLASLRARGTNYLDGSTSRPSDSFPGLMAIVSGATPRTIGPTEDDVSLLWLKSSCNVDDAVNTLQLQSPAVANIAGIGQIFTDAGILQLFNAPGLPSAGDSRTPDIIVAPNLGVTYSRSTAKQAEHGGFAHDDTNVMLLVSNPLFRARTVTTPVTTSQVAPTILAVLGLSPASLQAVQREGTQMLPQVPLGDGDDR